MDSGGAATGVINDYLGNGVATISGGSVTWNTTKVGGYGPLPDSAAQPLTDATQLAQAIVWRGHRIDPTGFYYLGARYYEPTSGRFLSPDPLSFAAGTSLYAFCNGDCVNFFDPDGRCKNDPVPNPWNPFTWSSQDWDDAANAAQEGAVGYTDTITLGVSGTGGYNPNDSAFQTGQGVGLVTAGVEGTVLTGAVVVATSPAFVVSGAMALASYSPAVVPAVGEAAAGAMETAEAGEVVGGVEEANAAAAEGTALASKVAQIPGAH